MFLTVNHARLYYEQLGSGQPLILLHGNGEDHTLYTDLMGLLASRFTVYALDSRDHGQSQKNLPLTYGLMAADVLGMMQQLHLAPASLVGFSDGGITALLVASQKPKAIAKLVVAGANLSPDGVKWRVQAGVRFENWRKPDPKLQLMLTAPHITDSQLQRISAPTFVLAGAKDVIRQKETIHIADEIPDTTLRIVADASHSSYVKDNQLFYKLIRAFLAPDPLA